MASEQQTLYVAHSSHLDLYWIGTQNECLEIGAHIIHDAVKLSSENRGFTFLIDTVRFLEYFLRKYPEKTEHVRQLFAEGQFEIAACYTDRLENHHDGESLVRNVTYGKRMLKELLGIDTKLAYHPDLPGLAEQSPQIYKKTGVDYYLFARGFYHGGRFWWKGLDDSRIIAYNFPVHYSYYNLEKEIIPNIREIKNAIQSDDIVLSCSAGDLGPANTFISKEENRAWKRVPLMETLQDLNRRHPEFRFEMSGVKRILDRMDISNLEEKSGEYPSKWGLIGSTGNVKQFHLDKQISAVLLEAEKFSSICEWLGMPVEYGPKPAHPLKHRGGSGGSRGYFELQDHPQNMQQWFDFAWKLQLITQDHNYAGINGTQSNFDRFRYKETALQIAKEIRDVSLTAIASEIAAKSDSLVVFNSLNWRRTEAVAGVALELDADKTYCLEDSEGKRSPLIPTDVGYAFLARDIPSVGYKTFTVKEDFPETDASRRTKVTADRIEIINPYYEAIIDRKTGALRYVKDRSLNKVIVDDEDFLSLDLYQDFNVHIMERYSNKVKRESTKQNVRSVSVVADHSLWTKVEVISEVGNCKVKVDIIVDHTQKEIRLKPTVYWIGETHLQLNLNLNFSAEFSDVVYGVPYGVQKKGTYLYDEDPYAGDEIVRELYDRYREVLGWFALQNGEMGIRLSSNHAAYDFAENNKQAVLIRNVPSGGDHDVLMPNNGPLEWEFRLSSYFGDWDTNEAYRSGWELQNPLQVQKKVTDSQQGLNLPANHSFIETKGSGILSVLKKSETDPGAFVMRMFNSRSQESECAILTDLPIRSMEACDMNELPSSEDNNRLGAYEIKTLKIKKTQTSK